MKISASILASDQNNIINNLIEKKDLFDYINSSNAKPKKVHKVLKELTRRGIKVVWKEIR